VLKDIWDSKAGLFDARDGHELLTVPGKVVLAARDRREFVWSDGSGWARAEFDPASGVEVIPVHEERKAPFQLAFSPDGRWLATSGEDGVRIMDWNRRSVIFKATGFRSCGVGFSSDSRQLFSHGSGGIQLWERLDSGQSVSWQSLPAPSHLASAKCDRNVGAFTSDYQRWVIAHTDPATGQPGWLIGSMTADSLTFDPRLTAGCEGPGLSSDGRWLAWGNWQATDAFVLDLRSQSAPHRFVIPGTATARFSPDCQSLVLCGPTEIQVVEPGTWRVRHSIGRPLSGELPARVGWEHLASQDFYL
jgi:WD40 repeat protein